MNVGVIYRPPLGSVSTFITRSDQVEEVLGVM